MKKIFLSSAIIFAAAAIVIGATSALFHDTETSNGNTFTASQLDLVVNAENEAGVMVSMTDKVFDEAGLVPGDSGEKDFEIRVDGAAACGTAKVVFTSEDNTCTEPESEAEEGCDPSGEGELDDAMKFTISSGSLPAPMTGSFMEGGEYSLGEIYPGTYTVKWELPSGDNDNVFQTDSFTGDLVITATQKTDAGCEPMGEIE